MRGGAKGGDLVNGCCESKSWALSERDLNKFIMKDATMRCVLSRSVASKTDTEGCAFPSRALPIDDIWPRYEESQNAFFFL